MAIHNEIVTLFLGIATLIFILFNKARILKIKNSKILILSYLMMLGGWLCTVLESFVWKVGLNLLEHLGYASSIILFVVWITRHIAYYKADETGGE